MSSPDSRRFELVLTLTFFALTLLLLLTATYLAASDRLFRAMMKLSLQSDLLAHRYVGEISPEQLFADAWQSMQRAIPFKVELVSGNEIPSRRREGGDWGLTLSFEEGETKVAAVTAHSPFFGILQRDDRITGVGTHRDDVFLKMREYLEGAKGDTVCVYFQRQGADDSAGVLLPPPAERPAFYAERLGDIGYIAINCLSDGLSREIADTLAAASSDSVVALIVDLRHSSGGSEEEANEVAEILGNRSESLRLVLLADGATGRHSERLAAQLLNRKDVIAVGEPTGGSRDDVEVIELWSGERLYVSTEEMSSGMGADGDFMPEGDSDRAERESRPGAGGGIIPDRRCETPQASGVVLNLFRNRLMLDFVVGTSYRALPPPDEEWQLFNDFLGFLRQAKFSYSAAGDALRELESDSLGADMRSIVERMKLAQGSIRADDLEEYRSEITRQLLIMIQQIKVGGHPSAAERLRLDDYCLQAAVEHLEGGRQ